MDEVFVLLLVENVPCWVGRWQLSSSDQIQSLALIKVTFFKYEYDISIITKA